MQEHHIETTVRGRYLLDLPAGDGSFPLLVCFHGYGQKADDQLALLRSIPGSGRFILCSIEALHPFINVKGVPGASWMSGQDRELRITENVSYVDAVIGRVMESQPVDGRLVMHGFSQGANMACRAALLGRYTVDAVMLLGGDIPGELDRLDRMQVLHIAHGDRDHIYTRKRLDADLSRLRADGLQPSLTIYSGGHYPTDEYYEAAGRFLAAME